MIQLCFKKTVNKELKNYLLALLTFSFFGCVKSDNSSDKTTPPPKPINEEVVEKISNEAKLPDLGDFKIFEFSDYYALSNDITCEYRITEKITVSQLSDTSIEQTYDRKNEALQENPKDCPSKHPDFLEHETMSWGLGQYAQMKTEYIKKILDPVKFQENREWVQSARILTSQELNYKNLRTQLVEMEIISKKGFKYLRKQYISLDSLFLARFELLFTRIDKNSTVDYQVMPSYSVKKIGSH